MRVHIENTYACGRLSSSVEDVRGPVPGETLDDWWEEVVHPLTGDGHPCGSSEDALYEATVVTVDDPELVAGDVRTWQG